MNNDILSRMNELISKIQEANYHYYSLDNPIISDKEWDLLYSELVSLERANNIVLDHSPTKQVGGKILNSFTPHTHIQRLYSMDKVQSMPELKNWIQKNKKFINDYCKKNNVTLPPISYSIEYKLDGLTLNLTYDQGRLVQAATRGNGIVGESVLPNAKTIKSIPENIAYKNKIEIQGECVMRLSVLNAFNKTHTEQLKNARNAAAGAIKNLDPAVTSERNLDAYFYAIGHIENSAFNTQIELISFLKENGFDITPFIVESSSFEEIKSIIEEIDARRNHLDFLIDGVVLKINDVQTRAIFGYTEKFPRWAIAYKFEAEEMTTKLLSVSWEVGRTGKLTPLGHVEPVNIGGVTISKATLNNFGDIQKKNLKIGSSVWIRRSNDVIPEILGRVDVPADTDEIEIFPPTHCPACNRELYIDGAHIFCPGGNDCKPQAIAKITHYASRDAMDIAGLSIKTAEALYDKNLLRQIDDLYQITKEDLLTLDKVRDKKADKLLAEIEKSKTPELSKFIFSLGINNIGKKTAKDLAEHFKSFTALQKATYEDLIGIPEIGDIVANSILNFFADTSQTLLLNSLFQSGIIINELSLDKPNQESKLQNLTVVITGTLPSLSRKDAESLIINNGGNVSSSVSKNTSFVLLGDNPGSKYNKAIKLGIEIKNEEEFLAML